MAKEYIEREAVVKELQEELDYESLRYTKEQNKHIDIGLGIALRTVKRLPAADVVEVVRCRDCKHGIWDEDEQKYKCVCFADYEPTTDEWYGFVSYEEADFYCGRGERRDNLENETVAPTIEAEPVKHGQWVHLGGDEWGCSNCGEVISTEGSWDKPTYKHCHECGAKMDGGADA